MSAARIEHVEVLVEEPSAEAALRALLPRVLGNTSFEIHAYGGKQALLAKLPARLRAYARWMPSTYRLVVLVDRDREDCAKLKAQLERIATEAGLATRSSPGRDGRYQIVNRIAIEELEAWYFGDWQAVCAAYPDTDPKACLRAGLRDPDSINGGTCEALERVLQEAGYFVGRLAKIEAARAIAAHMDPGRNTSRSFQVFRDAILEMFS